MIAYRSRRLAVRKAPTASPLWKTRTETDTRISSKDFVTDLNLSRASPSVTGACSSCNRRNLLFYPDKNRDDVPDGDPEVLLSGFGMEDSQSMANHLTWGPDGWLYGLNGSTTTVKVRGLEFQQGVWRYPIR